MRESLKAADDVFGAFTSSFINYPVNGSAFRVHFHWQSRQPEVSVWCTWNLTPVFSGVIHDLRPTKERDRSIGSILVVNHTVQEPVPDNLFPVLMYVSVVLCCRTHFFVHLFLWLSETVLFWDGFLRKRVEACQVYIYGSHKGDNNLPTGFSAGIWGPTLITIYGALFFIPWNSHFPSPVKLSLWRIAAAFILAHNTLNLLLLDLSFASLNDTLEVQHNARLGRRRKSVF